MKLRFTSVALADISGIADFIRAENPPSAEKVRASILESLENLARFPNAGRPQSVMGVRKFVAGKYRYLVYYLVDEVEAEIVVLTVQHAARERPFSNE
jgi:plasmid stabilization system protein ParE